MTAVNEEVKVTNEEVKTTSKTVELLPTGQMDFVFDEVALEQGQELQFKNFEFSVFNGLASEVEKVLHDYKLLMQESHKYSKEYLDEVRLNVLIDVSDIKASYRSKALYQLKEIRQPSVAVKHMTQHEEQMNMLKRLNNNIIASELMKTASVEELTDLWNNNKGNVEVRTMLKSRSFHLYRVMKEEKYKHQAFKLYSEIKAYEKELKNPDFLNELESIEANIEYIFSKTDMYPVGLENGFEQMKFQRVFD